MLEIRKKQNIKRRLYSLPVLVALLIITLLALRGVWRIFNKYRDSVTLMHNLEAQNTQMLSRETELKSDINRLDTGEGIDYEIKQKFNVSRQGESVAVIVDQNSASTSAEDQVAKSWWQRFWNAIIH